MALSHGSEIISENFYWNGANFGIVYITQTHATSLVQIYMKEFISNNNTIYDNINI